MTAARAMTMRGARDGRLQLIFGWIFASLGAFFTLSLSPLAIFGLLVSMVAVFALGDGMELRRRRKGRHGWIAWPYAIAIAMGLDVLAWVIALSLVTIF